MSPDSVEERLAQLERRLSVLESHVRRLVRTASPDTSADLGDQVDQSAASQLVATALRPEPAPASPPAPTTSRTPREEPKESPRPARGADYWIARVGIGLLLFGVAFLFKYAVDKGWLTPAIRIAFGITLGVALAVVGFRVPRAQRWFAPLVLGGSVATLYVTGYAAYEVFGLVPYAVALTYMTLVTAFAYFSAIRVGEVTLAILATLAGLATPFIITTEAGTVLGAVTYESAIVIGAVAVVLATGWTPLLWTAAVGGWVSLGSVLEVATLPSADRATMQTGIVITWLALWAAPLVQRLQPRATDKAHADFGPLILPVVLVASIMTASVWSPSDTVNGLLALAVTALYAGVWFATRERLDERATALHAITAAVFAAIAIQFLMGTHTRDVTWALEATLLLAASERLNDRRMRITADLLWILVAMAFVNRLVAEGPVSGVAHWAAFADLAVIALALVSARLTSGDAKDAYGIAAAYGLGGLIAREATVVAAGGAITVASWGAIAAVLHRLGASLERINLHKAGHVASAVTVIAFVVQLGTPAAGVPVVGLESVALLGTLVALAAGAMQMSDPHQRLGYFGVLHLGLLSWFWYELVSLPVGHAWVSFAWGVYGVTLLVIGIRRRLAPLRMAAFATLAAIVGKLFLVDLREVDPFWRIVLFLGFGGLFLALAYYFRALWGAPRDAGPGPEAPQSGI